MPQVTAARRADKVRIGPVSIITLIAAICMAVLAVLAVSTANATMIISERQAESTVELYLNESAAQEFVAGVNDLLASARAAGDTAQEAAQDVNRGIGAVCEAARSSTDGQVQVSASVDGTTVTAEFTTEKTRKLTVVLSIQDDATYRIERWKAAAAQQETGETVTLWAGA